MSSKLLNVQMKRSTVSTAIVGSSCGQQDVAEALASAWHRRSARPRRAPRERLRSRAVRKRKANGNERHASKQITVIRAIGRSICSPKIETGSERCERNATGSSQPSTVVPNQFTQPYCGLSSVDQTNVAATTGAT